MATAFSLDRMPPDGRGHGSMRELSGHDPREAIFPVFASVYSVVGLLIFGARVGFGHVTFWIAVGCCSAAVAALEWRVRRFLEVWGDDEGLMVVRAGESEKIAWRDVEAVQNHYSLRCAVLFRRDTQFGRILQFSLPQVEHLIGFEHPNALWMRQQVEAQSVAEQQRPAGAQVAAAQARWVPPPLFSEQLGGTVVAALFAATGVMMLSSGRSNPLSDLVTGTGAIRWCEDYPASRGPDRIVVHVADAHDGLRFAQPNSYLGYVRDACAAHAVVNWSAVPHEGHRDLVAFERPGVPGGYTEATYASWWRSARVLDVIFGSAALAGALAFAAMVIVGARRTFWWRNAIKSGLV